MKLAALVLTALSLWQLAGCEGTRSSRPEFGPLPAPPGPVTEVKPPEVTHTEVTPTEVTPTEVTPTEVRPDAVRVDANSDRLLRYFAYVRKLQGAELAKEHEAVRQLYAAARTDFNRLRYAVLLSFPGAPFNDEPRALDTIDPVLKNQNSELQGAAFMLSALIHEQRRSQGLQQKLDALRSLEKSLIEREGGKR